MLFIFFYCLLCLLQLDQPSPLLYEDFDCEHSNGLARVLLDHHNITLAKNAGPDGSHAIRVDYVGYHRGSERVVVRYPLGDKVKQATLFFKVKFDQDFQWVRGGKLHGLGPERPITGGATRYPYGWSARIMFKSQGKCSTYLYDQDRTKKWGMGQGSAAPVFKAGHWHQVALQVGLNTPGKADGLTRILVDEKRVVETSGVEFRGEDGAHTLIQQFLFSTFHGGNTPEWAPVDENANPISVYAYFDDFLVLPGMQSIYREDG